MGTSVGVVVPAYRSAEFLAATLDGVQAQTVADWRAVVVDDGSPDNSAEIADEYARRDSRFAVVRQHNAGVSNARNRGARCVEGVEYLLFCDGDDVLLPNAIEDLLRALRAAPGAVAAHGLAAIIDSEGRREGDDAYAQSQRYHYEPDGRLHLTVAPLGLLQLARESPIVTPAVLMADAQAFWRAGGFDPALSYASDWDMWLRLARVGGIVTLHREVVLYRKHDGNMAVLAKKSGLREVRRVRVATYRSPENSAADRKLLRRLNRQHHMGHVRTAARREERGGMLRDLAARAAHFALALYGRPFAP